jgi:D-alanyl-D-alanine dipeptidase
MRSTYFLFPVLFLSSNYCNAQLCKTDAKLINTKDAFLQATKDDSRKKLVILQNVIPGLAINMPYATAHNFTKTVLYRHPVAYLHQEPANALKQVQGELNKKGLALKIYDAYRPFSVTCTMWKLVPDRRYAANPRKGSNHNRAVALDLTIINLKTGKELDMGTAFDNFTDSAHHDFIQLPAQVLANRKLLKGLMWKYGFTMVPAEWWHYQWRNRAIYEVLDLDFDELKELVN